MLNVREHFYNQEKLFVHDGGFGFTNPVNVRVYSDDPNAALFLHHLSEPLPARPANEFEQEVVVYHASGLTLDPTAYGLPKGTTGACITNLEENRVLCLGTNNSIAIRQAITAIANHVSFAKGNLPLHGYLVQEGDQRHLIISNEELLASGQLKASQVTFAHNAVWHADGVSRAFAGLTAPADSLTLSRGDLVEAVGKTKLASVSRRGDAATVAHPTSVILAVNHSGSLSATSLSAEEAAFLYLLGHTGEDGLREGFSPSPLGISMQELGSRFLELMTVSGATAQVVNLKQEKLAAALAGQVKKSADFKKYVAEIEKSYPGPSAAIKAALGPPETPKQ